MANKCKDCGCTCKRCITNDHDVQLHVEIENLKQRLLERENHIVTMETNFLNEANKLPDEELIVLKEELLTWQDKYKRLYEAHRRVQRVNQGLEDKLLKLVDVCETEKTTLTKDVATLSHKLAEANYTNKKLREDNERYKNDVSLAIQFLQCKQSNFVAHKYDTLPAEIQSQVSNYMTTKKKPEPPRVVPEVKSIKVPIPTFPPTAMVYSVPKSPNLERKNEPDLESTTVDIVSAAIMAKVLEERQRERASVKHCDTCTCAKGVKIVHQLESHSIGTQTGDYKEMVCLKCNEAIVSITSMKIVRSTEPKTHKVVPIYPLETLEPVVNQPNYNVVKVQPNNFLTDRIIEINNSSSPTDITPKNEDIPVEAPTTSLSHVPDKSNEVEPSRQRICSKSRLSYQVEEVTSEKTETERNENRASPTILSPRGYPSLKLQIEAKNILLDNAHHNIPPVLYTRSHKLVQKNCAPTPDSLETEINSIVSDTSTQNQQRVADWIKNSIDQDISSSENSRSDHFRSDIQKRSPEEIVDRARYAEMEENVKRFLYGESEFMKTVELGKNKYKDFEEESGSVSE
ncbi:uncharacterized protein LOC130445254 isoform X1 [Diorhabda sublineata]|uniref:uncharacterized protein LOC130445254 isoform X1 n=1 Tax=Diorhabda sublineata TaxID=1163346 RepID=UPI0024E097DA|nr:uncharacterized protein LOC130445254 isoform X1 [Diorhabda sublineata]